MPIDKLLSEDIEPDAFDIKYGGQLWMSSPKYVNFLRECLSRRLYHIIFLSDVTYDHASSMDELRYILKERAKNAVINGITTHFPKRGIVAGIGAFQFIFECMKLCNSFVVHSARYGNSGDKKTYLTNMFLLAEFNASNNYIPLIVGMVEKSRIVEARKCFVNNTPMPTDLIELWVDSSIEELGSKIKPLFRKHMKFGIENAGLTIKSFPSLSKEIMFDIIPPVSTVEEIGARNASLLNTFYDYVGGKSELDYGPLCHDDSMIDVLLKDLDEVFVAIGE